MSLPPAKREEFSGSFDVVHPYTGRVVTSLPIWAPSGLEEALERAYGFRSRLSGEARGRILSLVAKGLLERKEEIARLITSESGLSLKDTRHEVDRAIEVARCSAQVAGRIEGDLTGDFVPFLPTSGPRLRVVTEPLDLAVAITPFNHPLNQVAHKVLPAVAAGTPVILKPSSRTPLSALFLKDLLGECGLEKEMLQVVTAVPAEGIVGQLVSDSRVELVTFTGGLAAGREIARAIASSSRPFRRYIPELGGCSSLIVAEDADLDRALEVALNGCFANSGQRCTAVRRIVTVGGIAEHFAQALASRAKAIRYGDPLDPQTEMGTVVSESAARQIEGRVREAVGDGARLLVGGTRQGALFAPTVLDYVSLGSALVAEETFGPVAPVLRVKNIEEAVEVARRTPYRLAGAVMTRDRELAQYVADRLAVGQFNWNGPPGYRSEAAPFGGFGDSGNGAKEGVVLAAQAMRRIRTFYEH